MSFDLKVSGRLRITELPPWVDAPIPECEVQRLVREGHARIVDEGGMNLVVNIGLEIITKMIGSAKGSPTVDGTSINDVSDLEIAVVKLGNKVSPTSPGASDTALDDLDPVFTISSVTVSYPTATSVRFSSVLPANQINGEGITEEGLFISIPPTPTEKLFAKRVTAVKVIQAAQAYQFDHDISLTAS